MNKIKRKMSNLYKKQCKEEYLIKYSKNGNVLREAEKFSNNIWVIWDYPASRVKLAGEYSSDEFKQIQKKYF